MPNSSDPEGRVRMEWRGLWNRTVSFPYRQIILHFFAKKTLLFKKKKKKKTRVKRSGKRGRELGNVGASVFFASLFPLTFGYFSFQHFSFLYIIFYSDRIYSRISLAGWSPRHSCLSHLLGRDEGFIAKIRSEDESELFESSGRAFRAIEKIRSKYDSLRFVSRDPWLPISSFIDLLDRLIATIREREREKTNSNEPRNTLPLWLFSRKRKN